MKHFFLCRIYSPLLAAVVLVNGEFATAAEGDTNSVAGANASASATTLDRLVSETVEKNPELKFYEAELTAAKAGRRAAGLWFNPELSTSVGQKSVDARRGDAAAEGIAWSVSLAQPFEWPGRIPLRKAIANRDIELAELGYARFRTALTARVRSLSYELFATQQKAAATREVADRFHALREVLVQRDAAGVTPLLEVRVIEANELSLQRKAAEAELTTQSALLELNQLHGVSATTHVSVAETRLAFRPLEELDTLLALSRTNNFDLRLRAAELAQQGFRVALAKNERFPAVSVGPSISEERAGDRERVIGVGISLPLPSWNRNTANIDIAKARQLQAETSFFVTQREVERQVTQAALRYERKLSEIARWRPDAVEHFREAADVADRHYRLGAVPVATYVELQEKYLDAVESLLDTKKDALDAPQQIEVLTGLTLPLSNTTTKEQKP